MRKSTKSSMPRHKNQNSTDFQYEVKKMRRIKLFAVAM